MRAGGHLVIPARMVDSIATTAGRKNLAWLPVAVRERTNRNKPDPKVAPPRRAAPVPPGEAACHNVSDSRETFRACAWPYWRELVLLGDARAEWQLRNSDAALEGLRIAYGKGSVTVMSLQVMGNAYLLRADNALLFASAMQAERGAVAWIVSEEARQRLVPRELSQGWVAVALLALAIGAGLWRSGVRFGPVALPATRTHRSMAEQVTGTAHFLLRHGSGALHEAQLRALEEAAKQHIPAYEAADARARAALIASRTHLDEHALANAMRPHSPVRRSAAAALSLMETARRRLDKKEH